LKQPLDNTEPFVPKSLQKSLSSLVSANKRKRSGLPNRAKPRVIIITPGYVDIPYKL